MPLLVKVCCYIHKWIDTGTNNDFLICAVNLTGNIETGKLPWNCDVSARTRWATLGVRSASHVRSLTMTLRTLRGVCAGRRWAPRRRLLVFGVDAAAFSLSVRLRLLLVLAENHHKRSWLLCERKKIPTRIHFYKLFSCNTVTTTLRKHGLIMQNILIFYKLVPSSNFTGEYKIIIAYAVTTRSELVGWQSSRPRAVVASLACPAGVVGSSRGGSRETACCRANAVFLRFTLHINKH